jgi:predicted MPP superfamily phosphohydrolase
MDKIKDIEKTEKQRENIKELFKEFGTAELYDTWADTFEIESVDEKQVIVYYHGTENIKVFRKECKPALLSSIYSVAGAGKKVKILKKKNDNAFTSPKIKKNIGNAFGSKIKGNIGNAFSSETKKNIEALKFFAIGMIFVCIAIAIIVVMYNYIGNRDFRATFYSTSSIKVDSPVRVIQLSDAHGAFYGKNNKRLLERIEALEPDIIICTGDMVNSVKNDVDYAVALGKGLSKIAPSYYIYGNNEVEGIYDFHLVKEELDEKFGFNENNRDETALLKTEDSFEKKLENAGIKVLKNEKDTIKLRTMTIDVYGVLTSHPSSFWSYSGKAFEDYLYKNIANLKITAVHEPFIFEKIPSDFWGDLMICGHTHGGVMRVPVIGPLFTREGGLFPERDGDFVYGRYNISDRPLIVSSGLENANILRINNQPEVVVIDINKF